MKKILLVIVIFLTSIVTYAQLSKGNFIIALDGSHNYSNLQNIKYSNLRINSAGIKLVTKNFGIGLSLGSNLSWQSSPNPLNPELKDSQYKYSLAIGPVFRQYFGTYKIKPYAEVRMGWDYWKGSIPRGKYHNNNVHNIYLRPILGLGYWISDQLSIDLNTGYDYDPIDRSHNWFTNLGFNINLSHKNH